MYTFDDSTVTKPDGGTKKAELTGTLASSGQHEIKLTQPVFVSAGQKFSVVVTMNDSSSDYYVSFEGENINYTNEYGTTVATVERASRAGESFYMSNNTWYDTSSTKIANDTLNNVYIMAYTEPVVPTIYTLTQNTPSFSGISVQQNENEVTVTKGTSSLPDGLSEEGIYLDDNKLEFINGECTFTLTEDSKLTAKYKRDISSVSDLTTYVQNDDLEESEYTTYNMTEDLDLHGVTWTPPEFKGSLDGQNHTISNLTSSGFLATLSEGKTVKRLKISGARVTATKEKSGGIVNECQGTIEKCSFDGQFTTEYTYSGAIVGYVASTGVIIDCANYSSITWNGGSGQLYYSGIAGMSYGEVYHCYCGGTVAKGDSSYFAPIVGYYSETDKPLTGNYWLEAVSDTNNRGYFGYSSISGQNYEVTQEQVDSAYVSYQLGWSYEFLKTKNSKGEYEDHTPVYRMYISHQRSDVLVGGTAGRHYVYGMAGDEFEITMQDGTITDKYSDLKINDLSSENWSVTIPDEDNTTCLITMREIGKYNVTFICDALIVNSTVSSGGSATPPTVGTTKTGYTGSWDSTAYQNVTEDLTINWVWTPNVYQITADCGDGLYKNNRYAYDNLEYNSVYGTIATIIPKRNGYTFTGWYTSKSGGTKITNLTPMNTPNNHTIYAHWKSNAQDMPITHISSTAKLTYKNMKVKLVREDNYYAATITGITNKKIRSLTIPKKITYKGHSYPVRIIGSSALKNCKKLKTLVVKSTTLSSVGKNALKSVYKKCKIKVPSSKKKLYKKLFKNKGLKKLIIK